jgi:outer membrane receptor for ferrienterochelin and colicins
MKGIILFILLAISQVSLGQNAKLKGLITNSGESVVYANVTLKGTDYSTVTDLFGAYQFTSIPPGEYELLVSMLGFKPVNQIVVLTQDKTSIMNVIMEEEVVSLDMVVITGTMEEVSKTDSPVAVEVYSQEFFKANPTPSIFESLQQVNGVRPQLNCNVCNTGDIHINGLEGPYTMVLIDGMPIVSGLSTVYGLTGIPQSLIERVEVVKGPASTLYGSEAVGGLINIITKKPKNAPLFSADVFSSTWADVNMDLGYKLKAGKKAQALIGVNYFNFQNRIDNNDDGFTDVALQNRISIFNKWSIERSEKRLFSFAGRYIYEDRFGGDMNWKESDRGGDEVYGESIYTSRWELFGTYQLPVKESVMFQFSGNGHNQNSVYGDVSYVAEQYVGFGQLTWRKSIRESHQLLVGTSFRYTYYDDNTPATQSFDTINAPVNEPSMITLPGVFVQDEVSFNKQNKLLAGLRYDYNNVHGNVFTPRLNYKWNSKNKRNIVRLGTGTGYRVANVFTEDHAALTGAREVEFQSELNPETSWNANINFVKKIFTNNDIFIGIDASVFYTRFNNRIIPDYETDVNKIIYSNLDGHAVSKGINTNVEIDFFNGLKLLVGATLMDVTSTENNITQRQLLTERFSGVWTFSYTYKKSNITIDYTGSLYGSMLLPLLGDFDDRPSQSPLFSLQNIQLTKKFRNGMEIYGGIKNLLNFTLPANSIARPFDPFDKEVQFDNNGQVIATADNPNALSFDPSYMYGPNQGIRGFLGIRYTLK